MEIITGYRIIPGYVNPSQLTEAYDVGLSNPPSDMPISLDWLVVGENESYERHEAYIDAFDYSRGGYGAGSFTWSIVMTLSMVRQWRSDYFGGNTAALFSGGYSAPVTVRHYDGVFGDGWFIANAIMLYPSAKEITRFGQYWQVLLRFVNVTTPRRAFSSAFNALAYD